MVRVKGLMLKNVPTLKKEAKIEDAVKLLAETQIGCIVVTDNEAPIGIVSEIDVVKKVISKGKSLKESIRGIMSSPLSFMSPNMRLDAALEIIDSKKFRRYPVVENDKLVGLVNKKDVINSVSFRFKLHRSIQIIVLIIFVLFEFFVFLYYGRSSKT